MCTTDISGRGIFTTDMRATLKKLVEKKRWNVDLRTIRYVYVTRMYDAATIATEKNLPWSEQWIKPIKNNTIGGFILKFSGYGCRKTLRSR